MEERRGAKSRCENRNQRARSGGPVTEAARDPSDRRGGKRAIPAVRNASGEERCLGPFFRTISSPVLSFEF
jgi:hypothetical protein